MPKCLPTDLSDFILPDLDAIAIQTQMIVRRSSKFSASEFLQSLLSAVVTGKASLQNIASGMGRRVGRCLSRQALDQRLDDSSTSFLTHVARSLLAQPIEAAISQGPPSQFNRILIEDSSFCPMAGDNAEHFPAHGNGKVETAGVKVDLCYDLMTAEIESFELHRATEQDKTLGKDLIDRVKPKDLVVRDMGYFVVSEFTRIERLGAFWLSRLPSHTKVALEDEGNLEDLLSKTKKHRLELDITLSNAGHRCRLVAIRAEKSVTKQRRKERKKKNTNGDHLFHSMGWIRDGWHLLITNISSEDAATETLFAIYRMRWDIEIQFRGWKQSLNLEKALNRKSSEGHLMALILAGMIHQILGMRLRQRFEPIYRRGQLSVEKLLEELGQFHLAASTFESIVNFKPDARHISKEERKRATPVSMGFAALN
ncbi:MAG: IS4 family transposase [Verrucomicrobiota bacterium]